ncbi:MAG: hydroxyethylthiazole kinase [Peptococcaceae bacterium]|nr:hydroxyethylthiazole kinase [Peptococcaceae bacterium]
MENVRRKKPLIHCITNVVVTNFTANGLLAIGASPVMAYAKEEVKDMVRMADALLLNIGTPDQMLVEAMILAGKAANKAGVPVVFDPVGAGATPYRTGISKRILDEVNITVLRGNSGEIASLLGETADVRGVDGTTALDPAALAQKAARAFSTVAAVTGEVDVVSDGNRIKMVQNGHPWMAKVVGTGCLLGAVISAFVAVGDNVINDAANALATYGVVGEIAYESSSAKGIGSFQEAFLNGLSTVSDADVKKMAKISSVEPR